MHEMIFVNRNANQINHYYFIECHGALHCS